MVFGTAFLIPKWATASTNRLWSCGVHTRRGRLSVLAGSSDAAGRSGESNSAEEFCGICCCCGGGGGAWGGVVMLKAKARSVVMRDWDKGMSSSGGGNSSSHFRNQFFFLVV